MREIFTAVHMKFWIESWQRYVTGELPVTSLSMTSCSASHFTVCSAPLVSDKGGAERWLELINTQMGRQIWDRNLARTASNLKTVWFRTKICACLFYLKLKAGQGSDTGSRWLTAALTFRLNICCNHKSIHHLSFKFFTTNACFPYFHLFKPGESRRGLEWKESLFLSLVKQHQLSVDFSLSARRNEVISAEPLCFFRYLINKHWQINNRLRYLFLPSSKVYQQRSSMFTA